MVPDKITGLADDLMQEDCENKNKEKGEASQQNWHVEEEEFDNNPTTIKGHDQGDKEGIMVHDKEDDEPIKGNDVDQPVRTRSGQTVKSRVR